MIYIGIDTGVSGSIGIIYPDKKAEFYLMPVKKTLDFTVKEKWIHRISYIDLTNILFQIQISYVHKENIKVFVEKPMVHPKKFNASLISARALECILIILEQLKLSYEFISCKEWQKVMLPTGIKGTPLLKKASLEIGKRLFPYIEFKLDADSLLIAEFVRKKYGSNSKNRRT